MVETFAGLNNRASDDDDVVYLPQYFSIRSCYGRYLDGIGYDIKTYGDGSYQVDWRGKARRYPTCS